MWPSILFLTIVLQTSAHVLQPIFSIRTIDSPNNIDKSQINGHFKESTYSEISLQWLNKETMKIIWSHQKEEVIHLTVSKQFPDLEEACLFEGSPENENSTISFSKIIGCIDSKETIMNVGIKDEILELVLLKNGTTLWNKPQFEQRLYSSRQKRSPSGWKETGGSIPSSQPRPYRHGVTEEDLKIPKAITFPLDLGYDESLYRYFGSSKDVKNFIKKVAFLAAPFFNKPQTGLPIIDWKLGDIKSYFNININADQMCCNTIDCINNKACWNTCLSKQKEARGLREGNSVPLILFVEDRHPKGSLQTTGCAFEGGACGNTQGEALGIVDMTRQVSDNQNMQHMARIMAHEFGHLIGMAHDFEHSPSSGCDHQGLMSYDEYKETWSTCSVKDFKTWWRKTGFGCKEIKSYHSNAPSSIIRTTPSTPIKSTCGSQQARGSERCNVLDLCMAITANENGILSISCYDRKYNISPDKIEWNINSKKVSNQSCIVNRWSDLKLGERNVITCRVRKHPSGAPLWQEIPGAIYGEGEYDFRII